MYFPVGQPGDRKQKLRQNKPLSPVSDNTAELFPLFSIPRAFQQRLVIGVFGKGACRSGTQRQQRKRLI